jgi:hypothetical protein
MGVWVKSVKEELTMIDLTYMWIYQPRNISRICRTIKVNLLVENTKPTKYNLDIIL